MLPCPVFIFHPCTRSSTQTHSNAPHTHTLTLPALQAVILCLFNGADTLSYAEVRELSGMGGDDKELRRNLMSLCVGKVRGGG